MCKYCRVFHAIVKPCEACGALPNIPAVAVKADVILTPIAVPLKPKRQETMTSILHKLMTAGMITDEQIAAGLRTGRVAQTIGYEERYSRVVEYLMSKGYAVEGFRARVVCGSLAA